MTAKAAAVEVQAGGRAVRVSSPDRVIYPSSEHGPEVTKLQVVEYYVAVADGIVRALRERPTSLERWPKGVQPGMTLTARDATQGRGPQGDAFYQKRLMRGMPDWARSVRVHFPSGRTAEELCPDHVAVVIHNYRWRLGLAPGEPRYDEPEARLAAAPPIAVPTITLEGDANGAPHPDPASYAARFTGRHQHRLITGGIGHDLPQEAPRAFADAVLEVAGW